MAGMDMFASGGFAEVIDRLIGNGMAIETWARISLARIEFPALKATASAASIDTYLKYAEAVGNAAQGQQA